MLLPAKNVSGRKCFQSCLPVCTGPWPSPFYRLPVPPQPTKPPPPHLIIRRTGPLDMFKLVQLGPQCPSLDMFKVVYYEAQTVGERAVGIRLKCLLVIVSFYMKQQLEWLHSLSTVTNPRRGRSNGLFCFYKLHE